MKQIVNLHPTCQTKNRTKQTSAAKAVKNKKADKPIFHEETEESELWQEVKQDHQLRAHHKRLLLTTPGYEGLSEQEADELTDSLLEYMVLLCELSTKMEA